MKSLIIIITVFMGILSIAAQDIEVDGIKYSLLGKGNLKVIGGPASGKLVIPDSVTFRGKTLYPISIGKGAFANSAITKVQLPTSITEIDDNAFRGSKVESINFPCRLNRIGKYAFEDTQLDSIFLPSSLAYHPHYTATGLDQYSFKNCKKLRVVEFDKEGKPSKDTRISFDEKEPQSIRVYYGAFDHCDNIEKVICNGKSPHFDLGWDQNYSSRTFPTMVLQFAILYCPAEYLEKESKWFDTVKPIPGSVEAYELKKQNDTKRKEIITVATECFKNLWTNNVIGKYYNGVKDERGVYAGTSGFLGNPELKDLTIEQNSISYRIKKKDPLQSAMFTYKIENDVREYYGGGYWSSNEGVEFDFISTTDFNTILYRAKLKDGNKYVYWLVNGSFYRIAPQYYSELNKLFNNINPL